MMALLLALFTMIGCTAELVAKDDDSSSEEVSSEEESSVESSSSDKETSSVSGKSSGEGASSDKGASSDSESSSSEGDGSSEESSGDTESSSSEETSVILKGYTEDDLEEYHAILTKAGYPISKKTNGVSGDDGVEESDLPTDSILEGRKVAASSTIEFVLNDEGERSICRLTGIRLWIKGGADEDVDISVAAGSDAATSKISVTDAWQRVTIALPFEDGTIDGRKADKLSITAGDESLIIADVALVVVTGEAGLACDSELKYKIESEDDIRDLIAGMSNDEKAAQICMAGWSPDNTSEWVSNGLGSYLDNDRDVNTFVKNYNDYQQTVIDDGKIPPIHSADAVHGHNYMPNAVIFPHNIGMGATRNPELVERVAEAISAELAATGIRWNLSPTVAVSRDERWGRMYESFGETPEIVAPLAAAYVRGMQKSGKIAATCKHFVADGGTTGWATGVAPDDTEYPIDRTDVDLSEADIRKYHLPPYIESIKSGALSIMAAYNTIKGKKIHASKFWLTDVLKDELGFKGVVVSDWNGMWLIEEDRYNSVVRGLNAGLDVLMAPYDVFTSKEGTPLKDDVLKAITSGEVSPERIEDALFRQLWVKWKVGLFDDPKTDPSTTSVIGAEEHREIARQAVRESMVLLKNEALDGGANLTLPLFTTGQKIVVGGSHADNAGLQSGGWSIEWQGPNPDNANYEGSTTIWQAMKDMSDDIHLDDGNSFVDDADIAVIFVGEMPYAEGIGDLPAEKLTLEHVWIEPKWSYINAINPGDQLSLMEKYTEAGIPVVMVLVTGRPLVVTEQIDAASAFMVAWLPGSEGQGVADVLFGDYSPTGMLPQTWPKTTSQIPINDDDGQEGLYKLGDGMGYK